MTHRIFTLVPLIGPAASSTEFAGSRHEVAKHTKPRPQSYGKRRGLGQMKIGNPK
jgi:hypothetical protein